MKHLKQIRKILSVLLVALITVFAAVSASAAECRVIACDSSGCSSDLYSLLQQYGCQQGACDQINELLNRLSFCQTRPCDKTCDTCEKPDQAASQTPVPAPTEAAQPDVSEAPLPSEQPADAQVQDLSAYETEVIRLINDIRRENGLSELTANVELSRVARIKAQDMHDLGYFSHTSPTYGSPFDMMKAFGIRYRTAGENIAMGYRTPQSVVDGWMNSPGHRANILNSSFTQIGVGYVADGSYWSQMFIG